MAKPTVQNIPCKLKHLIASIGDIEIRFCYENFIISNKIFASEWPYWVIDRNLKITLKLQSL